jgi:DNA-binding CsgD family transcriptional regulator/pimeloyl-ACP methyl ester carboxylesterase
MKPRVQYARTADGLDIAYWTEGSGPTVILPPNLLSHTGLELSRPAGLRFHRLSQGATVVRYDGRAQGLSGGSGEDMNHCSSQMDLQAVVDSLGVESFAMIARDCAGPIALRYAATHPERVSHLVLWHAIPRLADYFDSPLVKTLLPMVDADWELYTKTMVLAYAGWNKSKNPDDQAALFRASVSAATYKAFIDNAAYFDASSVLGAVHVPTLVLHRKDFDSISPSVSVELASAIAGAELRIVRGRANSLTEEGEEEGMGFIEDFLGLTAPQTVPEAHHPPLSPRESQILSLLAMGEHNNEISRILGLSVHTVERHVANVYAKIGARSRVEAAAYAMSRHLVQPPSEPELHIG